MQYHLESPWFETASNSNIIGAVRNHLSKEQHKHQPASKEDVWMSFKEPEELFLKTICRNDRQLCYRIKVVVPKNDFQGCLNCTNTVFICTRFNTLVDGNIKKWGITQDLCSYCAVLLLLSEYTTLTTRPCEHHLPVLHPSAGCGGVIENVVDPFFYWWVEGCRYPDFVFISSSFTRYTCLHRMFWMYSVTTAGW